MSTTGAPAATRTPHLPAEGVDRSYVRFPKDRRVVVDDGTTIAYAVWPPKPVPTSGPTSTSGAPPLIFANGWSCPDGYWADIVPALERLGHTCVLHDTRGHGASGLPVVPKRGARNLTAADLSIPRFAADLLAVLDHAGIERAVVVGLSMGVQTALETYRLAPDRVAALVLVAGPYENPLKTFMGLSVMDRLFPLVRITMQLLPEIVRPIWSTIGNARVGLLGARLARAAGPKTTAEGLHPYLLHLREADPAVLVATVDAMRRHSAADVLAGIKVPSLIVGAGHDMFTPVQCSEHMHQEIPGSEIVLFPDAAHTLPIEEPDAIVDAIEDFLDRRLAPSGQSRAGMGA